MDKRVVEAGHEVSTILYDAYVTKSLTPEDFDIDDYPVKYQALIYRYLSGEVCSVEAMYSVMKHVEENL